jgi:CheY-like chemotaxis protein
MGDTGGHAAAARVLVVDDDASIRLLVSDALENELDVEVECLRDGYEVIQRLPSARADLVLLDMIMPSVDGLAVLRWLRAHPEARPRKVVGFTAAGIPAMDQLRACGADDAIAKPFDVQLLLDTVRRHLGGAPGRPMARRRSA